MVNPAGAARNEWRDRRTWERNGCPSSPTRTGYCSQQVAGAPIKTKEGREL